MKIYSGVDGIKPPQLDLSGQNYWKACDDYEKRLSEFCKTRSKHKNAGEIIKFAVADGYAQYVVFNGTTLIHVDVGDGYHYRYINRLTAADINDEVQKAKSWARLIKQSAK